MSYYQHLSTEMPVARKDHRCRLCGEKILKGEVYQRENGLFEGDFQSIKMHPECHEQDQKNHAGETSWEFDDDFVRPKKS